MITTEKAVSIEWLYHKLLLVALEREYIVRKWRERINQLSEKSGNEKRRRLP